jgi:hypothetical protein
MSVIHLQQQPYVVDEQARAEARRRWFQSVLDSLRHRATAKVFPSIQPVALKAFDVLIQHPDGLRAGDLGPLLGILKTEARKACEHLALVLLAYELASGVVVKRVPAPRPPGSSGKPPVLYKLAIERRT